MSAAILGMELRLRARSVVLAAVGLVCVAALVGALYPSLGDSIGDVDLPDGVDDLLGGGEFSTIAGWLRTEIASVYGPLVFAGVAITSAAATTAGEEQDRILALVLAHPVPRSRLLVAKAAGLVVELAALAVATFAGLLVAVALAGGGIGAGRLAALCADLFLFGVAAGALSLALGAGSGRKGVAAGGAAAVVVTMWLVNGFAPLADGLSWLKYVTLFHYYEDPDPLTAGLDPGNLAVLALVAAALVAGGVAAFARRDLRG
jgi:ABC-2 type transport system permease protein